MQMLSNLPGSHCFLAFGIPSGPDLIILLVIVLVLFGAKRLPELARGLGQSVNEFKKAKDEFDKEVAKPSSTAESATTAPAGQATPENVSPTLPPQDKEAPKAS
jgi:TatA/E family protein of Tat protein translocase